MTATIPQAFEFALQQHQAGHLKEAESLYRQILAAQPSHAGALHHLGILAHQAGQNATATALIRRALEFDPRDASAHLNLGTALAAQELHEEAIVEFNRTLELEPGAVEAHLNLGAVFAEQGHLDDAVSHYRQALELQPDFATAHYNLGNALREQSKLEEAAASYRRAVELAPEFAEAHNNLGIALVRQGQIDAAIQAYHRALEIKANYAEAQNNLGDALTKRDRLKEAIFAFRRALELNPDYVGACINLGNALRQQGEDEEALATCRRALELEPTNAKAHNHLGMVLVGQGLLDEAAGHYQQAIRLEPDLAAAHYNLANLCWERGEARSAAAGYRRTLELAPDCAEAHCNLGIVAARQGQLDEAIASYHRAIELKPDFAAAYSNLGNTLKDRGEPENATAAYRRSLELDPNDINTHSNIVYSLLFDSAQDPHAIAEESRRWNRRFVAPFQSSVEPHANDCTPGRRLRIGYVSADFRSHSVSFFLIPLFESHDREAFEVYAYSSMRRSPDAITGRMKMHVDVWRDVRWFSNAKLAETIREDKIDILVDLSMHTADNRLSVFARQPAPVQASWLAYAGSTGVDTFGYRISDRYLESEIERDDLPAEKERAICLPDSWCCYAPFADFPEVSPLPAEDAGMVTFGSFNHFGKTNDPLLHCWAGLLAAVPSSRLLMICPEGQARERVNAIFAAHGIASHRLELIRPSPWAEFFQLYGRADIALDPFPCNGMTTTCHTLWMGVPVVTRLGATAISRASSGLLHTIGLPDWIAHSEEEYIRIATAWANDLPRLAELRRRLRDRMAASALMDAPRFARNIESAYRQMWRRWCVRQRPARL